MIGYHQTRSIDVQKYRQKLYLSSHTFFSAHDNLNILKLAMFSGFLICLSKARERKFVNVTPAHLIHGMEQEPPDGFSKQIITKWKPLATKWLMDLEGVRFLSKSLQPFLIPSFGHRNVTKLHGHQTTLYILHSSDHLLMTCHWYKQAMWLPEFVYMELILITPWSITRFLRYRRHFNALVWLAENKANDRKSYNQK